MSTRKPPAELVGRDISALEAATRKHLHAAIPPADSFEGGWTSASRATASSQLLYLTTSLIVRRLGYERAGSNQAHSAECRGIASRSAGSNSCIDDRRQPRLH